MKRLNLRASTASSSGRICRLVCEILLQIPATDRNREHFSQMEAFIRQGQFQQAKEWAINLVMLSQELVEVMREHEFIEFITHDSQRRRGSCWLLGMEADDFCLTVIVPDWDIVVLVEVLGALCNTPNSGYRYRVEFGDFPVIGNSPSMRICEALAIAAQELCKL